MARQMHDGFEERRKEYERRIREWLSNENREHFKGKTLKEIMAGISPAYLPVGEVPSIAQEFFGVDDPRVYSGAAYFMEHAFTRHPDLSVEDYVRMIDVLHDYENIYIADVADDCRLIFSKRESDRYWRCIIGKNHGNNTILYISYYGPSREVDSNKKILASRVFGLSPYRPDE